MVELPHHTHQTTQPLHLPLPRDFCVNRHTAPLLQRYVLTQEGAKQAKILAGKEWTLEVSAKVVGQLYIVGNHYNNHNSINKSIL